MCNKEWGLVYCDRHRKDISRFNNILWSCRYKQAKSPLDPKSLSDEQNDNKSISKQRTVEAVQIEFSCASCNCRWELGPLLWARKQRSKSSVGRTWFPEAKEIHSCQGPLEAVERNWYEIIQHPAYSLVLASCDYFLFSNWQQDIDEHHVWSGEAIKAAYEVWVNAKAPSSSVLGWRRVIEKNRSISTRSKVAWLFIGLPS